jgi:transcriptional regulator with XRE-family HTH domain
MKRSRPYSSATAEALALFGSSVRVARQERRWTLRELAERVGVTSVTMAKVEKADPTVAIGIAFEAAAIVGVPLFSEDRVSRRLEAARLEDRLAVLPQTVRKPRKLRDEF